MEEKISVIVPCYNVEKLVKRCIDSLKNQTYKNIEVLMVDDGSKDGSAKVIKEEIKNDDRFAYYYKENGGLSDARNFGMKKFTGKYVCFIDSDDYVEENYVEELYNAIIENNTKMSVCGFKRVYKNKTTYDTIDENILKLSIRPCAWNKMYLASLFTENEIEFPKGKWYEDLGTTSKLLFLCDFDCSIVKKHLYNYIQNDSSIMHTYDDRIFHVYDILADVEDFCNKKKIYEKYKDNLEFMWIYHVLIGTIYRASSHKEFSKQMINDIIDKVEAEYPDWQENIYLKKQPISYRMFLKLVKKRKVGMLYFALTKFAKYLYL